MYKMLIVDDEYYSREGIKRIIDWSQYQIEIVGCAENGVKGIEMIQTLRPDIVLTDIRMKAMDGLSMIEEIRKQGIDCKFIIMSGYKVFEYAQKALEEGVGCYLLKPILKEQLIDAIQKVILALNRSWQDTIAKRLDSSEYFIRRLVNKNDIPENWPVQDVRSYFVAIFRANRPMGESQQDRIAIFSLLLSQRENCLVCFFNDYELIVVYYNEENDNTAVRRATLALADQRGIQADVGIGDRFVSLASFSEAREQAYMALQYRFYQKGLWNYAEIRGNNRSISNELAKVPSRIVHAIDMGDRAQLEKELQSAYDAIETARFIPQDVLYWLTTLNNSVMECMHQWNLLDEDLKAVARAIHQTGQDSLADAMSSVRELCVKCLNGLIACRKGKRNMEDIIRYIDAHYMEDISLERLASRFYMDFNYLSKLLKKETGKTYIQYLTEKRMQKAKELMENPNLTVYEISKRVSYSDAKYFSRLFKRNEGITPMEYRANLLRKRGG